MKNKAYIVELLVLTKVGIVDQLGIAVEGAIQTQMSDVHIPMYNIELLICEAVRVAVKRSPAWLISSESY